MALISQCHALSSSEINVSSASSVSAKPAPTGSLDLSNSDLGPDLLPLPEDLVWDPKKNKTVAIKMDRKEARAAEAKKSGVLNLEGIKKGGG